MESRTLISAIRAAGYAARQYSGRGMYGQSCVGFCVDGGVASAFEAGAAVAARLGEGVPTASSDAMGRGSIIYFRGVPWEECGHPWHEEGGPEECPRCGADGQDEDDGLGEVA